MPIDISELPEEVQHMIELREDHDQTFINFIDRDYSQIFWNKLAERRDPEVEHSFISSVYGAQGSGKSMAALSMCCFLDPNFTAENIFFGYNDLVYNRNKLKPNTAVLVDEQSQAFGLDSHRVMLILSSLKEQLRKKSIHFIFCSPVLYDEAKSSMYQIETVFIDYEEEVNYCALKTREGHCLGHIKVPYPLKTMPDGTTLASKELLLAYEARKDKHLEKILGNDSVDMFDEHAKVIVEAPMFKKAEKLYVARMGYVPQKTCIQIINKLFPEFNAGVVPAEIAGRIKLDKELNGEWEISGRSARKTSKDSNMTAVRDKKKKKTVRKVSVEMD